MASKTYDFDGDERFTFDGDASDDGRGFVVITKHRRNDRGRFVFDESVCIPSEVWARMAKDFAR